MEELCFLGGQFRDVISKGQVQLTVGVIFDKRVTWRLHIEMIEAKAFRTFITV
jgi:hypothetical protein